MAKNLRKPKTGVKNPAVAALLLSFGCGGGVCILLLALAALGGGWYLTGGDLAALPERLKALRLPEWITLWQAHEPKPGARLI